LGCTPAAVGTRQSSVQWEDLKREQLSSRFGTDKPIALRSANTPDNPVLAQAPIPLPSPLSDPVLPSTWPLPDQQPSSPRPLQPAGQSWPTYPVHHPHPADGPNPAESSHPVERLDLADGVVRDLVVRDPLVRYWLGTGLPPRHGLPPHGLPPHGLPPVAPHLATPHVRLFRALSAPRGLLA
jgi:hypothetical protein